MIKENGNSKKMYANHEKFSDFVCICDLKKTTQSGLLTKSNEGNPFLLSMEFQK